ncbi:MAG: MFS transporter [Stellaceae bacterium]
MTVSQIRAAAGRVHYAWIVAVVTFFLLLIAAGVRGASGVLIVPLQDGFGWSRATISFAIGVNLLLYGLAGPFAAALMDRFGVRRTMALALAATALSVALIPTIHQAWQLVALWGVAVGVSTGIIGSYLSAYIATRWFRVRLGLVIGILTAANAAGQLIFLPTMAALISYAGWRAMLLCMAALAAGFLPLLLWLMRDHPADLGLALYGETGAPKAAPAPAGNPVLVAFRALGEGIKKRDFWLIGGPYMVCGFTTNGLIGTHLIPACVDHGLSEVAGASLLAAAGAFSFLGGTVSGWLSDRWDNRVLLSLYYALRGLSLLYLPFAFGISFYGLAAFSILYGLDWIASVPPTVRLLSRAVGAEKTGIMVAWITVMHQVGSASAAYLGGVMRVAFGTYFEAFLFSGLLLLAASVTVLFISGDREEPQPEPAALKAA